MQQLRIYISLLCLTLISAAALAQKPFEYDERGIVHDPAFRKVIKAKGYKVVGTFDTISEYPLRVRAKVLHDSIWKEIDQYGELVKKGENEDYFDDGFGHIDAAMPMDDNVAYYEWGYKKKEACSYKILSENSKYGTVHNSTAKAGLKANYDGIEILEGCLVAIKKEGRYGLANVDGTVLLKPMYDSIATVDRRGDASSLFLLFLYNEKWGVMDKKGNELISAKYQNIYPAYGYDENSGFFKVVIKKKMGLVDINDKLIIPIEYKNIVPFRGHEGWFEAEKGWSPTYSWLYDSKGRVLLESCGGIEITPSKHILFGKGGEKFGLMDTLGNILIQPEFERFFEMNKGRMVVVKNDKFGLINLDGEFLIEPVYYGLSAMYDDNLVLAVNDYKICGVLNLQGDTVIPFNYTSIKPQDSAFFYEKNGRYGRMDKRGKVIKQYDFDKMLVKQSFDYDKMSARTAFFLVRKGEFEGITDLYGNILVPLKYHRIDWKDFSDTGLARAQINYTTYWVDCYGNEYLTKL